MAKRPAPKRLTLESIKSHIAEAKKEAKDRDVRDVVAPCLVLRVRASGSWKWSLRRAYDGRDSRIDIGSDWTLDEAREIASEAMRRAKSRCEDPFCWYGQDRKKFEHFVHERRAKKLGQRPPPPPQPPPPNKRPTMMFCHAVELYEPELRRTLRPTTASEYLILLRSKDMLPLKHRHVAELTLDDLAAIVAGMHKRAERQAEILAVVLRGMWRFLGSPAKRSRTGVDQQLLSELRAPTMSLNENEEDPAPVPVEGEGLHVPKAPEIGEIVRWLKTEDHAIERDCLAGLLLVYTVQRRRYVCLARKSEFVDLGDGTGLWRQPPVHRKSASKAKRKGRNVGVNIVPLPEQAWAVVQRAKELFPDSLQLFPAVRNRSADKPAIRMCPRHMNVIFRRIGCKATPHDMRRAFATTYRLASGLRKSDMGLVLDHANRKEDEGAARVTVEHYAFSDDIDPFEWQVMRGWCDFVDACAAAST